MNEFAADRFVPFCKSDFGNCYSDPNTSIQTVPGNRNRFRSLQHPENHLDLEVKGYEKVFLNQDCLLIDSQPGISKGSELLQYVIIHCRLKENLALKLRSASCSDHSW
jgi:hypothetical protein